MFIVKRYKDNPNSNPIGKMICARRSVVALLIITTPLRKIIIVKIKDLKYTKSIPNTLPKRHSSVKLNCKGRVYVIISQNMAINPLVSIIITTKNEGKVINRLLKSIYIQNYKNIEVILIDNGSSDSTLKIAKKYPLKIYSFGPERSSQRNFGAKISKGNYLLFLDADMRLSKGVIQDCIKIIESDNRIGALNIPEISKATNFWERVKAFERSFYNKNGDPVTDAARLFRRRVFLKSGGYDESLTGPEDWDLPETIRTLGYKIERSRMVIYHQERISSLYFLAIKKFHYGLQTYRYLTKHNIPTFGPKTIYIFRSIFYKNWGRILTHPILSAGLLLMLFVEQIAGGLGYIYGRISQE